MNELIEKLSKEAWHQVDVSKIKGRHRAYTKIFAELVWKAAYEEGHDVGVDAGFEAGRNASFTEQHFGVDE
jgi:hypothetical protein